MAKIDNPVIIGNPLATQRGFLKIKKCHKYLTYSTFLLLVYFSKSTQSRYTTHINKGKQEKPRSTKAFYLQGF